MDLYVFIEFLRLAVIRVHIGVPRHFSIQLWTKKRDAPSFLGDLIHVSYYPTGSKGFFKLLLVPSLIGTLIRKRNWKRLMKSNPASDGLGLLFG